MKTNKICLAAANVKLKYELLVKVKFNCLSSHDSHSYSSPFYYNFLASLQFSLLFSIAWINIIVIYTLEEN